MKESYAENEEVFADIVISGRIFDCSGRARNGALAVKDGRYLAIGECDDISRYIGLDTVMCGYKNKCQLHGISFLMQREGIRWAGLLV